MIRKCFIFICFILFILTSKAQTNRALLIGIDRYPSQSGWSNIHGTNDIQLMYPLLIEKEYSKKDIVILQNEDANKKAIISAFNKLSRILKSGDNIYIHISTHGQQMVDDNGDEPDGLDEAIIPYDAKRLYYEGVYEGENHLRDDELGVLLESIRKKIGRNGNLIVVIDACHSGTGTRWTDDDEYVRGTSYIFAPESYDQGKRVEGKMVLYLKDGHNLSPITVLSACGEDELNYEYRTPENTYYGALTYALHTILKSESKPKSINGFNEDLRKQINHMFKAKRWEQTPYYETTSQQKIFRIGK